MIKDREDSGTIVRILQIKKKDIWTIRFLIGCGIALMILFIWWFVNPDHMGYKPIYWLLTMALLFKLVKMLHEWYHYWDLSIPVSPELKTKFSVDILTTACPGEPKGMIIRTLMAMKAIRYPHVNYLCDEGNDPELKKVCTELGVVYVTRKDKIDAKAGNINNALKQATGNICVVLDPDHVPVPEFLDRMLSYFEDPEIGFVQSVQSYGNQSESIIAKGAAEQTYHFYGPMMMSMNSYGTVQAIGANCTFRRKALDSIGGHAAGLSEDMHTAMQLHAKGWKSVYIPEILSRGLVPATLSAYYKQQLKWARGTFELLFRTYPKLYKNFTWRQKIHYSTIPLYFLFGLVNFIDIIIPLLALSLAEVPWEIDLADFAVFFLPLCGLSMIIRLFSQRWLLEKHERGFHFAGGVLRTATWWIFLIGFVYAVFNITVPYIPTPKEDEHRNYWKLNIPNIFIVMICLIGVIYGLIIDWSPYSIAMAFYAVFNAGMLGFIVFISQQRFLDALRKYISSVFLLSYFNRKITALVFSIQNMIYVSVKNGPIALLLGISLLFLSYSSIYSVDEENIPLKQKEFGGFFLGIAMENNIAHKKVERLSDSLGNKFEVISFREKWDTIVPAGKNLNSIKTMQAIPLINWELPSVNTKMWKDIRAGKYNNYLEIFASKIRAYEDPVFINFSPGFDDKEKTLFGNNSSYEFVKAWQYVYTFFNDLGISNTTWVWSPGSASSLAYYPGSQFVDWIGVSCLNYGETDNDDDRYSFSELYTPFRNNMGLFQKPVMITEMGSPLGIGQSSWFNEGFENIKEKFHEIHAVILFDQQKRTPYGNSMYVTDFNFEKTVTIPQFEKILAEAPFQNEVFINGAPFSETKQPYHSRFITGKPGNFKLMIRGEPFYVNGVAYNTAHDWRDGNMPLTRRQVEKDIQKIKEMGANTIRRYDHGIYDRNVLNIASENKINVIYGFWFDPEIDYYKDSLRVKEYIENVVEKIKKFKEHSSVIAWSIGNETWGLLKHNYSKPYLIKVRQSYVQMIELLSRRIHEIDPSRPVFSCMEHEEYQLPGELAAFHDAAPSLDVIGINSYYREQISKLNHVFYQFDSLRPYMISEFGPRGYWDPHYNKTVNKLLVEDSEAEKAAWYCEQWTNYIISYKGYNIGGVAYCWHDRMEGSNTWFGLTDYKGRIKLPYYALKEMWTKTVDEKLPGYTIQAPADIKPGQEYLFTAIASGQTSRQIHYEWALHESDYFGKVDALSEDEEGTIMITIPEKPSDYRLYLYVCDEYGNVSTASLPIRVN